MYTLLPVPENELVASLLCWTGLGWVWCLGADIAWVLGNLGSGPPSHVDALVGAGAIQPLVGTLQYGAFDLKREAAMALWQLCKDGRHLGSAVRKTNAPFLHPCLVLKTVICQDRLGIKQKEI